MLVDPNCSIYEAPIGTPSPSASIHRIAGIEIKPVVDAVDTLKDRRHSIWHAAREPKRSQAGKHTVLKHIGTRSGYFESKLVIVTGTTCTRTP